MASPREERLLTSHLAPQVSEMEVNGQFESVCESVFSELESQAVEALDLCPKEVLREVNRKHIFTHIQWNMKGIYLEVAERSGTFQWLSADEINAQAALPTAFRQFWEEERNV